MSDSQRSPSMAGRLGGTLGMAAAALVVVGVAGASVGVLPPFGGFLLMVLGLGVALVGAVTAVVGLVRGGDPAARPLAVRGLMLCVITVIAIAVPAMRARGLPRINDITTDVSDPPGFVAALAAAPNRGRDMGYPGAEFASQQQQAYPDLAPLVIGADPAEAFDLVRGALASMPRTTITDESRADGRVEATQTSALFHFADDVVVRIVAAGEGGSRIDVRSKSRDGKGDLGVNAARIRDLLAQVEKAAKAPHAGGAEP